MANLNSTTLAKAISASDTMIPLSSLTGVNKGDVLFVDLEAMPIVRLVTTSTPPAAIVTRTGLAASHGPGATVYTGAPVVFNPRDPVGVPPSGQQSYWVNTKTGAIWVAQGDESGPGTANRFWQLQSITQGRGPLGIRTATAAPGQAVQ